MDLPLLALLGFFAGPVVVRAALMWGLALREATRNLGEQPKWMVLPAAIFHSGPWLLLIAAFLAGHFLRPPLETKEFCFAGGFLAYVAFAALALVPGINRRKAIQAADRPQKG